MLGFNRTGSKLMRWKLRSEYFTGRASTFVFSHKVENVIRPTRIHVDDEGYFDFIPQHGEPMGIFAQRVSSIKLPAEDQAELCSAGTADPFEPR